MSNIKQDRRLMIVQVRLYLNKRIAKLKYISRVGDKPREFTFRVKKYRYVRGLEKEYIFIELV